jgi:hypothetical protein
MNKYQEALDEIVEELINLGSVIEVPGECVSHVQDEVKTLQELIDLHEPKEIKVGQACFKLVKDVE